MNLALFDFDGTITTDDSLIKFIRFVVGDAKFIWGMTLLSSMLTAYKLKLIPNYKAKQYMLSYFFKGMREEKFMQVANEYSLEHIDANTTIKSYIIKYFLDKKYVFIHKKEVAL